MKRIKCLIAIIFGVVFFTGCAVKLDVNMEISKEGKVDFGIIQAFDRELLTNLMSMSGGETSYTDDELKQFLKQSLEESDEGETSDLEMYKQKGFTVTEYLDDQFLGYKFITTINNIDNISTTEDILFDFSNVSELEGNMQEQKIFKKNGNQYVANFIFDANASSALDTDEETDDSTNEQMNQYLNMIEQIYTFTVTLPQTPISHNATTISEDGKTLTWTLAADAKTTVNFTFVLENQDNSSNASDNDISLWPYIIIGLGVLILVVVLIVLLTRKKENVAKDNEQEISLNQDYNNINSINSENVEISNDLIQENTNSDSLQNENTNSVILPIEEQPVFNNEDASEEVTTKNNFCTNCGTKIVDKHNNYCTNCGEKLK